VNEAPHQAIDALFLEERRYPPPPELAKEACQNRSQPFLR
jgi:hypothetical protein